MVKLIPLSGWQAWGGLFTPTGFSAHFAALNEHFGILKWVVSLCVPIYPTSHGANLAAETGRPGAPK